MRKLLFLIMLLPMLVLGQTLPISVRATNGAAFSYTNGITIIRTSGFSTNVFPTVNTDLARGTALRKAANSLNSGDTLEVPAGTYRILLPLEGLSNNIVFDFQPGAIIDSRAQIGGGYGAAIVPPHNMRCYNVTITNALRTPDNGEIQFGFGVTISEPAFTNLYLENCVTYGDADGLLFIRHTNVCSATLVNCKSYSRFDNISVFALNPDTTNLVPTRVDIYNSVIHSEWPTINFAANNNIYGLNCDLPGAVIRMFGGSISTLNTGPDTNTTVCAASANGARVELHSVALQSDGFFASAAPGNAYPTSVLLADNTYVPDDKVDVDSYVLRTGPYLAGSGITISTNGVVSATGGGGGGSGTNLWFGTIEDTPGIYTTNVNGTSYRIFPQGGGVQASIQVENFIPGLTDPPFTFWPQIYYYSDGSMTIPVDSGSRIQWKQDGTLNIIGATITGSTLTSYLPLAGGTLTGLLTATENGVSTTIRSNKIDGGTASFSGAVTNAAQRTAGNIVAGGDITMANGTATGNFSVPNGTLTTYNLSAGGYTQTTLRPNSASLDLGTTADRWRRGYFLTEVISALFTGNGAGLSNAVNIVAGTGMTVVPSGTFRTFTLIATNSPIIAFIERQSGLTGSAGASSWPGLTGGSYSRVTGSLIIDTPATAGTLSVTVAGVTSAGAWSQTTSAITVTGAGTIVPFVFACPGTNSSLTRATTFAGTAGPLSYTLEAVVETMIQ